MSKKMLDKLLKLLYVIFALITVFSLSITSASYENLNNPFIENINGSVLFIIMAIFYINNKTLDKKGFKTAICFSVLVGLIDIVGMSLSIDNSLSSIFGSFQKAYLSGIRMLGVSILCFNITKYIIHFLEKRKLFTKTKSQSFLFSNKKKTFFLIWLIILIAWIPYFLLNMPGILSSDSYDQINYILNNSFSNHHPFAHTMLIKVFLMISGTNNLSLGIMFYSIFQMLIMAGIFAFTIYYMNKKDIYKPLRIITLIFYALYPVNALYAVTMWKDILFSGFILLFTLITYEIIMNKDFFKKKVNFIYLISISLLIILFRNNGIYVILLSFIAYIIFIKEFRKQLLIIFISLVVINILYTGPIFKVLKVEKGSIAEALSVPLQQYARVLKYHEDKLTKSEKEAINSVFTIDNIDDFYWSFLSDPVKAKFDSKYFSENKLKVMGEWSRLFIKFPVTYIESYLANSYGYWYPNIKYWIIWQPLPSRGQIEGIERQSLNIKLAFSLYNNITTNFRDVPIISSLFSIGSYFIVLMFMFLYAWFNKRKKILLIFIPILFLFLTVTASPVYAEFRYIYAMLLVLLPITGFVLKENSSQ